jgi:RNA recognition motif-containing protein
MGKKLFVGKLPFSATDRDLNEIFSQVGQVVSAKVIMDRETGRSKGFGFVEFSTDEEAANAITQFNGADYNGFAMVVNEARPMAPREGGGGPRGGFGGGGGGGFGGGRSGGGFGGGRGGDRNNNRGGGRW